MSLTTKTKIENYLMMEINNNFNTQIDRWIEAVTAYIERYTGRVFEASAADTNKFYDGNHKGELPIDDIVSITSVITLDDAGNTDETLTEGLGSDYVTYPLNQTAKNSLKLLSTGKIATWPLGKRNIKITGKFGFAASGSVPADIELIATKLVAAVVQKGLRGGEISSERLGDYSVSFIEEQAEEMGIKDTLDKYTFYEV